jgi:hypothetical protein
MAYYRRNHLDLSTRVEIAVEMLQPIPERKWGRVTELAKTYNVSRTLLYDLRDRAKQVLSDSLLPRQPGPHPQENVLIIDRAFLQRAVVVLSLLKGTIRDTKLGFDLLFGVKRSIGYISQTLAEAGVQATTQNRSVDVPLPILGEADEIFQGRKPCLTIVDGRSFMVVNLTPATSRDSTTWGVTYLELAERGIAFHDLACDGGKGLQAGLKEAELAIPLRPDLFHLMRDGHRLTRRLEKEAYKAIDATERARRADLRERGLMSRQGRPIQIKVPLPQAEVEEAQAIALFDHWYWLIGEIRQALEPITPANRLVSAKQARETIQAAIELLKELTHPAVRAFAYDLEEKIDQLVAPLEWLEQQLMPIFNDLDDDSIAFILWAWQHRRDWHLNIDTDIPEALRPMAQVAWDIFGLFHRSSSLAESLHSWLRPYLQIHRGMPEWMFPLLQMLWNHHPFTRGKRAGNCPLQLAGVEDVPTLADALERLFQPTQVVQAI